VLASQALNRLVLKQQHVVSKQAETPDPCSCLRLQRHKRCRDLMQSKPVCASRTTTVCTSTKRRSEHPTRCCGVCCQRIQATCMQMNLACTKGSMWSATNQQQCRATAQCCLSPIAIAAQCSQAPQSICHVAAVSSHVRRCLALAAAALLILPERHWHLQHCCQSQRAVPSSPLEAGSE
jgi:hypothetical protein